MRDCGVCSPGPQSTRPPGKGGGIARNTRIARRLTQTHHLARRMGDLVQRQKKRRPARCSDERSTSTTRVGSGLNRLVRVGLLPSPSDSFHKLLTSAPQKAARNPREQRWDPKHLIPGSCKIPPLSPGPPRPARNCGHHPSSPRSKATPGQRDLREYGAWGPGETPWPPADRDPAPAVPGHARKSALEMSQTDLSCGSHNLPT
ncbi:hypothetical protein CALVIDRAFT_335243 [Calocera viscosa TUFC12733]|uniref:Uncharacterized protein n=1 Tax=Calocera viscosa (strain TUFC12733) TaxID=1330018 RepID=A0A167HMQ7_CALVF|nr:hypothetical protein CALVIDRAFT_335243 [Calocera viscosa TUFC12733]